MLERREIQTPASIGGYVPMTDNPLDALGRPDQGANMGVGDAFDPFFDQV
jgi:hypothetical protein